MSKTRIYSRVHNNEKDKHPYSYNVLCIYHVLISKLSCEIFHSLKFHSVPGFFLYGWGIKNVLYIFRSL